MKKDIHPKSRKVAFVESWAGNVFLADSTIETENTFTHEGTEYPSYFIEISSKTHPHYTGEKRLLKTGAIDKFHARQKKMEEMAKKK